MNDIKYLKEKNQQKILDEKVKNAPLMYPDNPIFKKHIFSHDLKYMKDEEMKEDIKQKVG